MPVCPSCHAENEDPSENCFTCGGSLSRVITRGTVIASRYEVLKQLGKGGMGVVYKAHDRELDETVAIKILRAEVARSKDMAKRFRDEIRLARKVRHKNVCGIHEYGDDQGQRYISMEYVEGVDLRQVIRTSGPLAPAEAVATAIAIAEGLHAIHEVGIIHRDLKTPNIMRDPKGRIRLMDFGIAKDLSAETGATATGMIVGTPEYMSPEQAKAERLDARSDVYALGIVIFELLTGTVPFRGETPLETILKQIQQPAPLDGPEAARIPPPLRELLERTLAKNPDERFASAEALAAALRELRVAHFPEAGTDVARALGVATPTPVTPRPSPSAPTKPAGTPAGEIDTKVLDGTPPGLRSTDRPRRAPPASDTRSADVIPTVPPRPSPTPATPSVTSVPPTAPRPRPPMLPITSAPTRSRAPYLVAAVAGAAVLIGVGLVASRGGSPHVAEAPPSTVAASEVPVAPTSEPAAAPAATAEPTAIAASIAAPATKTPTSPPRRAAAVIVAAPVATSTAPPTEPPVFTAAPTAAPTAVRTEAPLRAEAAGPGLLHVVVLPWAYVDVDGVPQGPTPFPKLTLAAGRHTVRIRHEAYEAVERQVTIRPGETETLKVDLKVEGTLRK